MKNFTHFEKTEASRGAIALYTALFMLLIILSSALTLSSILSRQIRLSEDIVASERAFYAANSGVEEALLRLVQLNEAGQIDEVVEITDGQVLYDETPASYTVRARLITAPDFSRSVPCVASQGFFRQQERNISLRPTAEEC